MQGEATKFKVIIEGSEPGQSWEVSRAFAKGRELRGQLIEGFGRPKPPVLWDIHDTAGKEKLAAGQSKTAAAARRAMNLHLKKLQQEGVSE
jgi:hypothetical protein